MSGAVGCRGGPAGGGRRRGAWRPTPGGGGSIVPSAFSEGRSPPDETGAPLGRPGTPLPSDSPSPLSVVRITLTNFDKLSNFDNHLILTYHNWVKYSPKVKNNILNREISSRAIRRFLLRGAKTLRLGTAGEYSNKPRCGRPPACPPRHPTALDENLSSAGQPSASALILSCCRSEMIMEG